jgi:hypothetical protein
MPRRKSTSHSALVEEEQEIDEPLGSNSRKTGPVELEIDRPRVKFVVNFPEQPRANLVTAVFSAV